MKHFKPGTLVKFIKRQNNELPRILREGKRWKELRDIQKAEEQIDVWKYVKYNSLCLVIQPYRWSKQDISITFNEHIVLFDGMFLIAWFEDLREVKTK